MSASPQSTTKSRPNHNWFAWFLSATALAVAGTAIGFLLPPSQSPQSPTSGTAPVATDSTADEAGEHWLQEFALSVADVRDTQEAPALAIDDAGRIALAWASKTSETERTLFFTSSTNHGRPFDEPRVISTSGIFKSGSGAGGRGGHERRMLPRLAFGGGSLSLAWCDAPADGSSVRMLLAESRDGGVSFSQPAPLHQSEAARPTFTSLSANESGQVAASWLDCRNGPQQVFAAIRPAREASFLPDTMVFSGEHDQGVCPCCPTASYVLSDGTVLVAYRSTVDGYRDSWICRWDPKSGGAFSQPLRVTPPTWKFVGCPHDGPSIVVSREMVHMAWMDAHTGRQRTYYGRAKLSDMKFDVQELNAAGPGTQGNPKLCIDRAGRLHALWEESLADESPAEKTETGQERPGNGHQHAPEIGAGRAIMHACSPLADGHFDGPRAVHPQPNRFQMRPAVAAGVDGLVVAWMELDEAGKRVVVTRLHEADRPKLTSVQRIGEWNE